MKYMVPFVRYFLHPGKDVFMIDAQIDGLLQKGVQIPRPESVEIGPEVDPDRISGEGVTIHSGCRIYGEDTVIGPGASVGYEAPVTLENTALGKNVRLGGGFFKNAVFLAGSKISAGAHVREGTILEENASCAHTVGLKQTILFPYVTLGSLVNFCDILMAGGTGKEHHGEVGSSYIHFNFTPHGDKATASLIGDVPRGVMLNRPPVFLGGQGGMVGPCRIAFGTVAAAGSILRKDESTENRLIVQHAGTSAKMPFVFGMYRQLARITRNNVLYIAHLIALKHWYRRIRIRFVEAAFPEALFRALLGRLDEGLAERIRRLSELARKMPASIAAYQKEGADEQALSHQKALSVNGPRLCDLLTQIAAHDPPPFPEGFLAALEAGIHAHGKDYIPVIKDLSEENRALGTEHLQGIVDDVVKQAKRVLYPDG